MVKQFKKNDARAFFVPAGIFLGMGFGFLLGNFLAYMLLGLGLGFLALALTKPKK